MASRNTQRTFLYDNLPKLCFAWLEQMRNKNELTDITITVEKVSIYAHRVILAAAIPYFRDKWTQRFIKLHDVEPNAVQSLIDYAYTSEVNIDADNVESLLTAACLLKIDEVKQACCDFLFDGLAPETACNVRHLAVKFNCSTLLETADSYISEHFSAVSQTRDFLNYPAADLKELLDKDDLNVEEEEEVLDAVLRWAKELPEYRKKYVPTFLRSIRMPEIEPLRLERIGEKEDLIQESSSCQNLIEEAKNYNLYPEIRNAVCSFKTQPRRKKTYARQIPYIFKLEGKDVYTVQRCNLFPRKWIVESAKVFGNISGSAVHLQNKMYFFRYTTTLQYDPKNYSFNMMRSMLTLRDYFGATALNDSIYICGGRIGSEETTNVVECFVPAADTWTSVKSMTTSRRGLSAVTLGQCIFAIGGTHDDVIVKTVEKYDPTHDMWTSVSSMNDERFCGSATTLNSKIYVCGGMSLNGPIISCEVYDPDHEQWAKISPLKSARYNFDLLSFQRKLYAIGGADINHKNIPNLDIYNPEENTWTSCCPANSNFVTSGAVVMEAVDM